uniref:Uncharacterized protein n=1 Tax=Rhizophora mucronata TaxID=61149 RepID=A0A2P2Q7E5_RHIMU
MYDSCFASNSKTKNNRLQIHINPGVLIKLLNYHCMCLKI